MRLRQILAYLLCYINIANGLNITQHNVTLYNITQPNITLPNTTLPSIRLPNINCSPQTEVVQGGSRYLPIFVKLHRCRGSLGTQSPDLKKCVPKAETTLNVVVFDKNTGTDIIFLQMKNHTGCTSACAKSKEDCRGNQTWNNRTCSCECKHTPPPTCKTSFTWNEPRCKCERSSGVTAKRAEECTMGITLSTVIPIALTEFLLLTLLFALFYKFCLQKDDSKLYVLRTSLNRRLSSLRTKKISNGDRSINYPGDSRESPKPSLSQSQSALV